MHECDYLKECNINGSRHLNYLIDIQENYSNDFGEIQMYQLRSNKSHQTFFSIEGKWVSLLLTNIEYNHVK